MGDVERFLEMSESNFMVGQPKLDGVRAIASKSGIWSRNGKPLMPSLHKKMEPFFRDHPDTILDGEIYMAGVELPEILSRVRLNQADKLKYWAFDIMESDTPFYKRAEKLMDFAMDGEIDVNENDEHSIHLCNMATLHSMDEILEKCVDYIAYFEGLILRHPAMEYSPGRSAAILKLKPWETMEGKLMSIDTRRGVSIVEILGKLYSCIIAGRTSWWNERTEWPAGLTVTVKFLKTPQGELKTPVLLAVRDYE